MARSRMILLANELGHGLGHLAPLRSLVGPLQTAGYDARIAIWDIHETAALVRDTTCPVLIAPHLPRAENSSKPRSPAASFGDILFANGYDSVTRIRALVRAWRDLLMVTQTELLIADHAPTACLVARWCLPQPIPILQVGVGFCVPPTHQATFPRYLISHPEQSDQSQILANICEAIGDWAVNLPPTLPAAFAADWAMPTVLPMLDPYAEFRAEPALGPLMPLPKPMPPPHDDARSFVYVNADNPAMVGVLESMLRAGIPLEGYFRNPEPQRLARLRELGMLVHDQPQPIHEAVARSRVVISHASTGLSQIAMAIGRPTLGFPEHFEHLFTASLLHRLGVAHYQFPPLQPSDAIAAWQALAKSPQHQHACRSLAEQIAQRTPGHSLPRLLSEVAQRLPV